MTKKWVLERKKSFWDRDRQRERTRENEERKLIPGYI